MEFLGREALWKVFFCFFFVFRPTKKDSYGEPRSSAITFRADNDYKLFANVNDSNKDYKCHFFVVRVANLAAKETLGDMQKLNRLHFPQALPRMHYERNRVTMQNLDYATDRRFLFSEERESVAILEKWAARLMEDRNEINSGFLVENFETSPGTVTQYLKKCRTCQIE